MVTVTLVTMLDVTLFTVTILTVTLSTIYLSVSYLTQIPGEREETYIYTRSRQCGGHFAKQKVLVKETAEIKLLKPFNFTGGST